MYKRGLHPGATWKCADFQIHTPRDTQWSGSPSLPGGTEEYENARKDWGRKLVEECIARGITALAITDHHDLCLIEYVRSAIEEIDDPLTRPWLFPGMEVTCNDSVQCLVLFDVNSEPAVWHRLYGGHLQDIVATPKNEARVAQATLCGKEIKEFLLGLVKDKSLNPLCIALPHASNDGAHKSMLRAGFQARFRDLPFDGVYTEKPFVGLDGAPRNKIYGKVPEWGTRRRGIIPTGDNRNAAFPKLGANECWIRLGEPTAEAIRQAVLADEARITYATPTLPPQRIELLEISSSLTGKNFELSFNDGFTALIGGRGAGKSAVLEYLRFGLGRSEADYSSEIDDERSRERALVADTLDEGWVKVTLIRDGVRETWTRTLDGGDTIIVALPDGLTETLTIPAAQDRFRARGFYQKQLSTMVSDRRRAAEQITGIAAAQYIDRRQQSDRAISAAKREVQVAFQRMTDYWETQAANNVDKATIADLKRRIEALRKQLEESGLTPENQATLDEAPVYGALENLILEAETAIKADAELVSQVSSEAPSLDIKQFEVAKEFSEVHEFVTAFETAKGEIDVALSGASAALGKLATALGILKNSFVTRKADFDIKYTAAAEQQTNLRGLLAERERLTLALQAAEVTERQSASRFKALEKVPELLAGTRARLIEVLIERQDLMTEIANEVQTMSSGVLQAVSTTENVPQQYRSSLLQVLQGSGVRDADGRAEELVTSIVEVSAYAEWSSKVDSLIDVLRHKLQTQSVNVDANEEIQDRLNNVLGVLTPRQMNTIYSNLEMTSILNLLTAVPDHFVEFQYRDAKDYIPFGQASPGQQASALLHLLLNQQAGTLVIDQPEDDLDNRTIMNVVHLLQLTKQNRQLIFATHNPNFVVNGDADKVVALTPAADQAGDGPRIAIEVDGAIETPAVRDAITDIMEGGKQAFELRSRKYQFGKE